MYFLIQDSIILTSETLEIPEDIFVNADKSADLFVDATQVPRAFNILSDFTVTIKGLKIIVGSEAIGGGAQNDGYLTLIDVDIYDPTNSSTSVISNTLSGELTIQGLVRILEN